MFLHPSYEFKIRTKIIIIYIIVISYFAGIFIYSYKLKRSINVQKNKISHFNSVLLKSNRLISAIEEEQNTANAYLSTQKKSYLKKYESISNNIVSSINELDTLLQPNRQDEILINMGMLLKKKQQIIKQLSENDMPENPVNELNKKFKDYQQQVKDSVIVTTNSDSVVIAPKKRNFWERLKYVFAENNLADTTLHVTRTEIDTLLKAQTDTLAIFNDIRKITQKNSDSYYGEIIDINKKVRQLILAEQEISLQISQLLNLFQRKMLENAIMGVGNSEELTKKIFIFSLVTGGASLLFILTLILFITADLNKAKQLRAALAKEKETTESLMNSRHKLLLSVSHDIKTPLSAILGYIDLWKTEDVTHEKAKQLDAAQNAGQHILSMLTNLLQYSRLEQNTNILNQSVFNLPEVCKQTVEILRNLAESNGLTIGFVNRTKEFLYVKSDYTAIRQILINMLSNAIKYTSEGYVQLILEQNPKNISFTIKDTGIGMDKKDIENLFKPFSRAQNTVAKEGSGFGLYVTKGLVETLRGKITVASEPNKGTSVHIQLPLPEITSPTATNTNLPQKSTSKNIMIFEDDKSIASMLCHMLQKMNHNVTLCDNVECLHKFAKEIHTYDVVFTDMEMNKLTGYEVLKTLRVLHSTIPVWLMTAHDDMTDNEAKKEGFTGLITKPFTQNILQNILAEHTSLLKNNCPENNKNIASLATQFPLLYSMFKDDIKSISDILRQFVQTAETDIKALENAVYDNDFATAQHICHKMLSSLAQLNADDLTNIPRKMDQLRGCKEGEYPVWKEDLEIFIKNITVFISRIKKEYL